MRYIMNNYTQYHFFPILCAFFMTILGEISGDNEKNFKDIYKAGLAISLIGLASMIFIYIKMIGLLICLLKKVSILA